MSSSQAARSFGYGSLGLRTEGGKVSFVPVEDVVLEADVERRINVLPLPADSPAAYQEV